MGGLISGTKKPKEAVPKEEPTTSAPKPPKAQPDVKQVQQAVIFAKQTSFRAPNKKVSAGVDKKAARSLYRLAECDENRFEVVREGGVLPLIELFQSKLPEVQENCLRALSELCKAEECRARILDDGGWEPMLVGLRSKRAEVVEAAVDAVWNFAELDAAQFKLVEQGAITCLLNYLSDGEREGEVKVLQTLLSMSSKKNNMPRIIQDGVLQAMFDMVHSTTKPLQHRVLAMQIVSQLCSFPASHQSVVQLNGNTGLQKMIALASSDHDQVSIHAATALEHLLKNAQLAKGMVQDGAMQPLEAMLACKHPGAVLGALNALIEMARDAHKLEIMERSDNCIGQVVKLCQAESKEVEERATVLLALLAEDSNMRRSISSSGGLHVAMFNAQCARSPEVRKASQGVLDKLLNDTLQSRRHASTGSSGSGSPIQQRLSPATASPTQHLASPPAASPAS